MKKYSNPALEKKFADIEAAHIASPEATDTEFKKDPVTFIRSDTAKILEPIWHETLDTMYIPDAGWRVDQLVSEKGITAISAIPGRNKTNVALDVAINVAQGTPLFGQFETQQCNVLIIDEESGLGRLRKRLRKLHDGTLPIAILSENHLKMSRALAESTIAYCKANDMGMVIFDSLTRFHNANENSSQEMSGVLENFQLIAQAGIAVIIIHHDPKNSEAKGGAGGLRGSGDILAISDVHNSLRRKNPDDPSVIVFKQFKNRDGEEVPEFELAVKNNEDNTRFWFEYIGEAPRRKSKDERTEEAIFKYLQEHGRSAQTDIVGVLKHTAGGTKVANILNELAASKKLKPSTEAYGKKYFELPEETNHE